MSKLRLLAICLILPAALFVRSFAFVSTALAVGNYPDAPFCIPTTGYVTQLYHSGHKAIDIGKGSGKGPAIYAPYSGEIIYVGRGFASEGKRPDIYPRHAVVINHGKVNGKHVASFFAHMGANGNPSQAITPVSYIPQDILDGTLKTVSMGTLIGYQGTAGVATGTHTHFAVGVKTSSTPFYSWNIWTTGSIWTNPKSYIVGSSSLSVWDYLETNCRASGGNCSIAPGQGSSRQVLFQQAYDRKGGQKVMGCATTGAFWWAGMVRQDFEGSPGFGRASILHDERADNPKFSIPAYVVQGNCSIAPGQGSSRQMLFQQAYDRVGGPRYLGCALGPARWWNGVVIQEFPGVGGVGVTAIVHDEVSDNPPFSIPAYVVQGGFWGWYQKNSFVYGPPASDAYFNAFGPHQTDFRDGFIYWTAGGANARRYFLKGSTPTVYLLIRGRKHPIPNLQTKNSLDYPIPTQTISDSALAVFPTGDPIPNVNDTWLAQYYDNMVNRRPAKVIRGEGDLNFGWHLGSPHSLIPKDNFSARFVKYVNFPVSGRYRFHIVKDDGGRLWIDGKKIFDKWCHTLACVGYFTVDQDINAGTHLVRFDHYERGGSATASLWWDTLDKEGPQVSASFSSTAQGGSGWYQAPVTVTLSASDPSGVDRIECRLDGSWQLYEKPVILSGDGVYQFQFRAYDRHGNQSSIYNEQVKIDKTPPEITGAPNKGPNENGWYNEDVTVHFEAGDQPNLSGLKSVTSDTVVSIEGKDQEVTGTAEDNAGNVASATVGGINIDKTKPESALKSLDPYYNNDPLKDDPIQIFFTASDNLSGLQRIGLYKRPVGTDVWQHHWTSSSGNIPHFNLKTLAEGRWEFASRATDLAGNKEELPQESDVSLVLDQTPPQTTLSVNGPPHQKEDKLFVSPQTEFELTADDTNQTDPSIETSGVAQTNYQIDKDEEQIYEGEFPIESEDGKHEIKYQSDDVAGNSEPQRSQEVYLDSTPPVSSDNSDGEWRNEDVAVLIVSSDGEGSGVKAIYYNGAQTSMVKDDEVVVVLKDEGVHELSYYAVDNVENVEGVKHAALVKIDKTPPKITGAPLTEPNENEWYSEDVVVHFEAEDQLNLSSLKSVTSDTVVSIEGKDQEVTGTAEDNAGNVASTTVGGINIDKTDPSSEITFPEEGEYYNQESWEQGGGAIKGTTTDNLSGVASVEVEADGGETGSAQLEDQGAFRTDWEYPFDLREGSHTIHARATDLADNEESTAEVKFVYDNTPPTSEIEEIEDHYINEEELDEGVELEFTAEDNIELKHVYLNERYEGGEWRYHPPVEPVSGTEAEGEFTVKSLKLPGSGENREGLWEFSSSARDKANNEEVVGGVDTWVIYDVTPPTSTIISVTEDAYYNAETWPGIYGTADDNLSGVAQVEVRIDKDGEEGEWVVAEGTEDWSFDLTPEDGFYTVYSRATDLAGNQESTDEISFVYDATPPVTSVELSGTDGLSSWYVSKVSLSLTVEDLTSGIAQVFYSIGGSDPQVYEDPLAFGDGYHTVEFWSVDLAGNEEEHQIASFKIDQTPPSSQLNELDLYYNNPFELTYTYLDNLSGVERARLYKRVPGEDWGYHGGSSRKPSKPFKVGTLSEGRWEFASVAVDYAGNIEALPGEADTWTIYDITPPTSIITSIEEGTYYNYRTWPGIFGEADDNLSGVAQVEVRIDKDGEEGEWVVAEGSDSWSFDFNLKDGFYTVYSRVADRAENQESTFKVSFVYDNTPPLTSAELSGTEGLNGWYVSPVTLSLSVDDANPSQTFYLIGDSDPQVYSELLNFEDGEHTIEFWSVDLAGNEEEHQTISFRIDSVAPQAPMVSISGGTFTEGEILRVSLAAEEGAEIYYSLDGSEPILYSNLIAIAGDATLSVYTIDEAGNRSALVEFNYVFSAKGAAPAGGQGSALGGNLAPQVLGVQSQETPGVSQGRDLVDGVAGLKGEGAPTAVGEASPKGSEIWLLLLAVSIGGIPYLLLRWWIFLKK